MKNNISTDNKASQKDVSTKYLKCLSYKKYGGARNSKDVGKW